MLTEEENEILTRVGPGTPMGELFRRYWEPVAAVSDLDEDPIKKIKILGEELVLYRDKGGRLGLVGEYCPHRRASLSLGWPDDSGIRCAYHGWLYDETGQCQEQPMEPEGSIYYEKIRTKAYPVQVACGLVFAYMGPDPVPLMPRLDVLEVDNAFRTIRVAEGRAYNWLQAMENIFDPVHNEWLHSRLSRYVAEKAGRTLPPEREDKPWIIRKVSWERYEFGAIKRRFYDSEDDPAWRFGNRQIFPNIRNTSGYGATWHVPIDDNSYRLISLSAERPGIPIPPQEKIPVYHQGWDSFFDEKGNWDLAQSGPFNAQDEAACATQGVIADRSAENLAVSDTGIIMYRQMLFENLDRITEGQDPMNVFRDPDNLPLLETYGSAQGYSTDQGREFFENVKRFGQPRRAGADTALEYGRQAAEWEAAGKPLIAKPAPTAVETETVREYVIRSH